jgi:hypothetical protein
MKRNKLSSIISTYLSAHGLIAWSKSNGYEADVLKLYFQAVGISNIADNTATAPAANIYVSLHTADPTDTGGLASEAAYTGYARVAVVRSAVGWTVSGTTPTQVAPAANIDFPICTAVPGTPITHFGVSKTVGGTLDYIGTVTPNIVMAVNVIPRLTTASTITED